MYIWKYIDICPFYVGVYKSKNQIVRSESQSESQMLVSCDTLHVFLNTSRDLHILPDISYSFYYSWTVYLFFALQLLLTKVTSYTFMCMNSNTHDIYLLLFCFVFNKLPNVLSRILLWSKSCYNDMTYGFWFNYVASEKT